VGSFIENMELAYAAADVVVFRAGATTIAEITRAGKAAILVPYPLAAEDHQTHNAMSLVGSGAAVVIRDAELQLRLDVKRQAVLAVPHHKHRNDCRARSQRQGGRPAWSASGMTQKGHFNPAGFKLIRDEENDFVFPQGFEDPPGRFPAWPGGYGLHSYPGAIVIHEAGHPPVSRLLDHHVERITGGRETGADQSEISEVSAYANDSLSHFQGMSQMLLTLDGRRGGNLPGGAAQGGRGLVKPTGKISPGPAHHLTSLFGRKRFRAHHPGEIFFHSYPVFS